MVNLAVVGAGVRGLTYAGHAVESSGARVVAIAEPRAGRLAAAAATFGVGPAGRFSDWRELLGRDDLGVEAVVLATPDRLHADAAVAFIERGLPLLLEKPMAPTEAEAVRIVAAAERHQVLVCVAHVLRYTPYTRMMKQIIDGGRIGDVVSIQHLEPVGWWHQAHSFVRGNWRREDESSSMLLAKCCHDVDWLSHLVGRPAERVSSFGGLAHFTPEHKPAGASERCLDCAVERECPYSAKRIYLERLDDPQARAWPLSVLTEDVTTEGVTTALRDGPYGRCVYDCDNDVVDHQVVDIQYAGGVTASLTMTGFTPMGFRQTRVFGTRGSVQGDGYVIEVFDFLTATTERIQLLDPDDPAAGQGHLGADEALTAAFLAAVEGGDPSLVPTTPAESLHTHRIVWAAERARRQGRVETVPAVAGVLGPTPGPLARDAEAP